MKIELNFSRYKTVSALRVFFRNPSLSIDMESLPRQGQSEKLTPQLLQTTEYGIISQTRELADGIGDDNESESESASKLPSTEECGRIKDFINRIYSGDVANLAQFPWYVLNKKKKRISFVFGVIIVNRE